MQSKWINIKNNEEKKNLKTTNKSEMKQKAWN